MDTEVLLKRYKKAESEKHLFRDLYEEAFRLCIPDRNNFDRPTGGQQKDYGVYDSMGQRAATGFVNRMQSTICPPEQKWAEIRAGEVLPQQAQEELNPIYQKITEGFFAYLNSSNFAVAAGEMFMEVGVGTGAMLFLEGKTNDKPFIFRTVSISDIAIDEDAYGEIAGVWRKMKIERRNIPTYFDSADLSEYKDEGDPNKKVTFLECTYANSDGTWTYCVIDYKTHKKIDESVLSENPWIIMRWSKAPNETYGRGPFVMAIADLKTANKLREMSLRQLNMTALGVFTGIDSDIMNVENLTVEPGVIIPVKRNSGPTGPTLQPLPVGGDINSQFLELERLEMAIKETLLDTQLPPEAGAVRSATEIVERVKQLQVDVGSSFGRIMAEFVQPIVKRGISILLRKGLISVPDSFKIDNFVTKVQLLSPIAKQQRLDDVQSLINAMQMSFSLDPQGQVVPLVYDIDRVVRYIAEQLGVNTEMLRTEAEVDEMRQQAAQLMMQQQLQQQGQTAA